MDSKTKQALWKTADQLRSNMSSSEYKHIVLGLIFLKYISDSFETYRKTLLDKFSDKKDEEYISEPKKREYELEDKLYYTAANVFWVPEKARWEYIRNNAKQGNAGKMIDDAMTEIESKNPALKNILNKSYSRANLSDEKLASLIDTISTIGFNEDKESAKDTFGEVYEYFLGEFANAEGKKGGQFYTAASIVKTLVAVMAPHKGRVYDPCCGSGGMFVQSEKFIEKHKGNKDDISIYGQESNSTTWKLAAMNLAIRSIGFNLGKEPADTFFNDQHKGLKADFVLANPPFNVSEWGGEKLQEDERWVYGVPPAGNANYAWIEHILYHLAPAGIAGIVLANGSMSSNTSGEGEIRKALIEADIVECMVALPGQLFFNTQIPVCLWFFKKQKKKKGEILFIDARKLGFMATRVNREFADSDISKIADSYHLWNSNSSKYEDIKGFCKAASLNEVKENNYILTPGRYVGIEDAEEDTEPFNVKFARLRVELEEQFEESEKLEKRIRENLGKVNKKEGI
ncbi:MAG: type I restriction-modification system subunit M [Elusimicrobiota bacterium]|jgi:type I restriction enzyme M protein|nr:type I restriction-modification system subunit M [Elusimicrobiota bacterium]